MADPALDLVSTWVSPLPSPQNTGEMDRALRSAWGSVAFEQVDLEVAADDFYDNAIPILERA